MDTLRLLKIACTLAGSVETSESVSKKRKMGAPEEKKPGASHCGFIPYLVSVFGRAGMLGSSSGNSADAPVSCERKRSRFSRGVCREQRGRVQSAVDISVLWLA